MAIQQNLWPIPNIAVRKKRMQVGNGHQWWRCRTSPTFGPPATASSQTQWSSSSGSCWWRRNSPTFVVAHLRTHVLTEGRYAVVASCGDHGSRPRMLQMSCTMQKGNVTRRAEAWRVIPPRGGILQSSGLMRAGAWLPEIKFLKNYSLL